MQVKKVAGAQGYKIVHDRYKRGNDSEVAAAKAEFMTAFDAELTFSSDGSGMRVYTARAMEDLNPLRVRNLFVGIPDEDLDLLWVRACAHTRWRWRQRSLYLRGFVVLAAVVLQRRPHQLHTLARTRRWTASAPAPRTSSSRTCSCHRWRSGRQCPWTLAAAAPTRTTSRSSCRCAVGGRWLRWHSRRVHRRDD